MAVPGGGSNWGTIGSPQKPTDLQLEQSAANQAVKQAAVIVKDTLEIPFSQMGGDVWKYKSDPDKPILPMYLGVFRSALGDKKGSWLNVFHSLKEKLPASVKEQFEAQLSLSQDRRDPRFQGLIVAFEKFAKVLDFLRSAQSMIDEEEKKRREKREAKRALSFFEEMILSSKKIGESFPLERGDFRFYRGVIEKIYSFLPSITERRRRCEAGETEVESPIPKQMDYMRIQLKREYGNNPPLFFEEIIHSLEKLDHLSYPGLNQNFVLTLSLFQRLFKSKESLSPVGSTFWKVSAQLVESRFSKLILKQEKSCLATLLLSLTFCFLTSGLKRHDFGQELLLTLFLSEKLLIGVGGRCFLGLFASFDEANLMGESLLALLVGLLVAEQSTRMLDQIEKERLIEVVRLPLKSLVAKLLQRKLSEEENNFLHQMEFALKTGREEELFELVGKGFNLLSIKPEVWVRDLQALRTFYHFLDELLGTNRGDEENFIFTAQTA